MVWRSDEATVEDVATLAPSHVIISPGPCTPREAGISTEVVRRFGPTTPILGVCLGHQCIGEAYGGLVVRAGRPMHGKTSRIEHDETGIFAGVPSPVRVARYHSLVIAPESVPSALRVVARSLDDGEIMAVVHREHPVVGVQFHPESAATHHGYALIERFLHGAAAPLSALPTRADGAGDDLGRPVWGVPDDERAPFVPPPVEHVR